MFFWIDAFAEGVNLGKIRNEVIERCRRLLMSSGFTVSAKIANNVSLGSYQPIAVQVDRPVV